jgi:hypothetical protein
MANIIETQSLTWCFGRSTALLAGGTVDLGNRLRVADLLCGQPVSDATGCAVNMWWLGSYQLTRDATGAEHGSAPVYPKQEKPGK